MEWEKDISDISDDTPFDFSLKVIKFPYMAIFILVLVCLMMAPTYPCTKTSHSWNYDFGAGPSVDNLELQPPIFVILNGFEWDDNSLFVISSGGGGISHHAASPYPMLIYIVLIILLAVWIFYKIGKNQFISMVEEEARLFLVVSGLLLLALGIILSFGLFFIAAFTSMILPIGGRFELLLLLGLIAPAVIASALYLLEISNKFEKSSVPEYDLTAREIWFSTLFSILIISSIAVSLIAQASITEIEPPPVPEGILTLSVSNITILSSTSVRITFDDVQPGHNTSNLRFTLLPGAASYDIKFTWPDQTQESPYSLLSSKDDINATYHTTFLENGPTIYSGDYMEIYGLTPNTTYFIHIYYITGMDVAVIGSNRFTMPNGG